MRAEDSTAGALPVALAALGCLGAGSLYGWSALAPALVARFDVSHAETGQTFSLAILGFTAGALVLPRLGPRGLGPLAAALASGALLVALAGRAPGFGSFLAFYSLGFGTTAGCTYIAAVEIASRGPRPTWGVPLVVAAFGLGGALFGGLLGGRVAAGAGLAALDWVAGALLLAAAATALARTRGSRPASLEQGGPLGGPILRLWVVFAAGSLGGLVALGLAQPIAADRGAGPGLAAAIVVAVALGNVAGRLGAGLLAARLSPVAALLVAQALGLLALLGLLVPAGPAAAALLMTGVAAGYGLTAAGVPLLARETLGPAAFARGYGVAFTGWGAAGLVGPWLAGSLRDATGTWGSGLALAAGGSVVALLALLTGRWD